MEKTISEISNLKPFLDKTLHFDQDVSQKQEPKTNKIFDFFTLPYVCQRRFAEICDSQTLKTFSSINSGTRNLCKRCHIIENVDIDYDALACKYSVYCFCNENEFCRGTDNFLTLLKKIKVRNSLSIRKRINSVRLDENLFLKLPITIHSTQNLFISFYYIELDDLKILTSSIKFKYLNFMGGIKSNSAENFIEYIKDLSKNGGNFKFVCPYNNAYYFTNEFIKHFKILKFQKYITKFGTNFNNHNNHDYPDYPDNTLLHFSKELFLI